MSGYISPIELKLLVYAGILVLLGLVSFPLYKIIGIFVKDDKDKYKI